jgi:hypothetical protein
MRHRLRGVLQGAVGALVGLRVGLPLEAVSFGLLVQDEAADERNDRGQAPQGLARAAAGRLLERGDAAVEQREAVRKRRVLACFALSSELVEH